MGIESLLSPLMGKAPDYPGKVPLDPETEALVKAGSERASRPASEIANEATQAGIEGSKGFQQQDQNLNQEAAGIGGTDPGMLKAIRDQFAGYANKSTDRLKSENQLKASMYKGDLLNRYAKAALGWQAAQNQQYEFLTRAYNQTEAARSAFVNQLFQTADVGLGMYAAKKSKIPMSMPEMSAMNPNTGTTYNPFSSELPTPPTPQMSSGGMYETY